MSYACEQASFGEFLARGFLAQKIGLTAVLPNHQIGLRQIFQCETAEVPTHVMQL